MLTRHQRILCHLLGAALKAQPIEPKLFEGLGEGDWRKIYKIAQEQSVVALVCERILTLPKELLPSRALRLEMGMAVELIGREHDRMVKELSAVREEYEAHDLPFVLLKGLTMAQLYPDPRLRTSGDLDLYLWRPGDYQKANDLARHKGYRMEGDSIYEQLYWRGRTAVENHKLIAYFGRPRYDEALRRMLAPIQEAESWGSSTIGGVRYRTLPLELNVVYCFQHILHHFSYLGIGFRQICDWVLLIEHHQATLDGDKVLSYAEALDLVHPMRLFALMAVRHLGVGAEIFPFALGYTERDARLADMIIADIFRGGNFGLETFAGKRFGNIWLRRWYMWRKTALRSLRMAPISPAHIRFIPLVAIGTRLRLLLGI